MNSNNEKVKVYENGELYFWCEGCRTYHLIRTKKVQNYPIWSFNNDIVKPTIRPSVLVQMPIGDKMEICHSFITDGKIQYLGDCTHSLKGKIVELKSNFGGW